MPEKARLSIVFLLMLTCVNSTTFDSRSASQESEAAVFDHYILNVTLDAENRTLFTRMVVNHTNQAEKTLEHLYFHLYPNDQSFRINGGRIRIINVSQAGTPRALSYRLEGENGTVLRVDLLRSLKPGDKVLLSLVFEVWIPTSADRFGYSSRIFALGNWYPILAVYEEGWRLDPYYRYGESFYSLSAFYDVFIDVPREIVVAATGVLENTRLSDGRKTLHWRAGPVRDFAWIASHRYNVTSKPIHLRGREVVVYSYHLPENMERGERVLEIAERSLTAFSDLYGAYPYPEYRVCEVRGWFSGMEYPMLSMIASSLYPPDRDELFELVIAHETAHQWWYGVVGNDESREPWLDESFAEYSQCLYFEEIYGPAKFDEVFSRHVRRPLYSFLNRHRDDAVAQGVWHFGKDAEAYRAFVYKKGAWMLHMLRYLVGEEIFHKILGTVYDRHKFDVVHTEDFITISEEVASRELDWFFDKWLFGTGVVRPRVKEAEAFEIDDGFILTIALEQMEEESVMMEIPVTIHVQDGVVEERIWINGTETVDSIFTTLKPLYVIIDSKDHIIGEDVESPMSVSVRYTNTPGSATSQILVLTLLALIALLAVLSHRREATAHAGESEKGSQGLMKSTPQAFSFSRENGYRALALRGLMNSLWDRE